MKVTGIFFILLLALSGCKPDARESKMPAGFLVSDFVDGINVASDLEFAPDGRLFFLEKNTGKVRVVKDGALEPEPWAVFSVDNRGERGLLGMAFDPDFENNGFVYFFYSPARSSINRIVRLKEVDGKGADPVTVIEIEESSQDPSNNGGRMSFGPDGMLYVSTGDRGMADLAQKKTSLLGKILRLDTHGPLPLKADDPESVIFASGFRMATGMAWNPLNKKLYVTDRGPVGHDEINLVEEGADYGWPKELGKEMTNKRKNPLWDFGRRGISPSSLVFYPEGGSFPEAHKGNLFIVDNRIGGIYRARLSGKRLNRIRKDALTMWMPDGFSRTLLNDITVGPDGALYIAGNSKIVKIDYTGTNIGGTNH